MNSFVQPTRRRVAALLTLASLTGFGCSDDTARSEDESECVANLLAGDLVISEIMVDPDGADKGQEWFEIFNPGEELDLTGVVLRFRKADGSGERLHLVEDLFIGAGQYLVVGDADPDNLPAHVDYGYGDGLGATGFNNTAGEVALGCGGSVVDIALYGDVESGRSRAFDGTRTPDAVGNDDLLAWCSSVTEFGENSFATPGAPNDPCFSEMPTTCLDGGTMRDLQPPMPGDLVITEFMPNPAAVGDDEGEWFELYVERDLDLNGVSISKPGDEEPTDVVGSVECIRATAGSYLVFAHSSEAGLNGGLPAVDQLFTLSMSNTSADGTGISVGWGGQVLDTVTWNDSGTGASTQLDPKAIDPERNDDPTAFCEAMTPYGDGDLGTPGAENEPCPIDAPEGMCVDGDELRAIRPPSAGDVWITEFMADPSAVADGDGEWFEIQAGAAFDLNALQFGREDEIEDEVDVGECLSVSAGDRAVFAKNADAASNGGIEDVAYEVGMSLINSNGRLYVAADGEVLDEIAWTATESGASRALDPSITGPEGNDDEANWCDGADAYGEGDLGTPGTANPACGGTPPGTCDDGGNARDIVFAGEGDLVITEFMADPSAVADGDGEWFEVLVTADVDLNGLQFGDDPKNPDETLPISGDCIPVSAGDRIVFAHTDDSALNGGIEDVVATFGFGLTNSADNLFVGVADTVIDEIAWTSTQAGASTSVAPGSEDAAGNDDELNHCISGTAYGDGDLGSPGGENVCE